MTTGPTGSSVETCTNLPFGDGRNCTGTDLSASFFTDMFHDSESNLEHTWFRQLSSTQGRWLTPDPYSGSMDLTNPQSLNRYSYVKNDPMDRTDALGLDDGYPVPIELPPSRTDRPDPMTIPVASTCPYCFRIVRYQIPVQPRPDWRTPQRIKTGFYQFAGALFDQCIKQTFGADANRVPTQTLKNAPILDLRYTSAQLTRMAGQPAVGWNQPSRGHFGTVYIASDYLKMNTANVLNFAYGTFAHELANILDERLNPNAGARYGRTYGNPNDPRDTDTGAAVEQCTFGGITYP